MSKAKILFFKCMVLTVLVFITEIILGITYLGHRNSYLMAHVDKIDRLQNLNSPKLILVGDSNLAFGVDSELMQYSLKTPTVNMGLHGGIGLRLMLSEVKPYINRNDTIMITPTFQHFSGLLDGEAALALLLINDPKTILSLSSFRQIITMIKALPVAINKADSVFTRHGRMDRKEVEVYSRYGFNKYGDVVSHLNQERQHLTDTKVLNFESNSSWDFRRTVQVLNDFHQYVNGRGAKVFYLYPSIREPDYKLSKNDITSFHKTLAVSMTIPVLGSPEDYVFNEDLFFDTAFHLNEKGRYIRTMRIIQALKTALASSKTGST